MNNRSNHGVRKIKICEGDDPLVYGHLVDRLRIITADGKKYYVMLMVDEMKLKNEIYVNVMTGEVVGFVAENGNFRSARDDVTLLSIIDEFGVSMSENESGSPVSYAN